MKIWSSTKAADATAGTRLFTKLSHSLLQFLRPWRRRLPLFITRFDGMWFQRLRVESVKLNPDASVALGCGPIALGR
eukprot:scaffold177967_cov41-Prasinocladus_malaysianus.AAC.1